MTSKAEEEIWLAELFAGAHNRDFGTDFVVEAPQSEADSADAYLVSKKLGQRIGLQICLASTEDRMREERLQDKIEADIVKTLREKGLSDCDVTIVPGHTPQREDRKPWHDGVVDVVLRHYADASPKIEIDRGLPSNFGDLPFSSISIHRYEPGELNGQVAVYFVIAKEVLEVDATIQGAIDRKIGKVYADAKKLWLILQPGDGAHTVVHAGHRNAKLQRIEKFGKVWWIYPRRENGTEIYEFGSQGSE